MKHQLSIAITIAAVVIVSGLTLAYWLETKPVPASNSSPIPPCAPAGQLGGPGASVPAGQYTLMAEVGENNSNHGGGPIPMSRISAWSQSNSTYYLYILNQSEYDSLGWTSNATGNASHSTMGPAQQYVWYSGPVTSTNHTVLIGNGEWYAVVYNPGSDEIKVRAATASCNAP